MPKRLYLPRTLIFRVGDIDFDSITENNLTLTKNNKHKIDIKISAGNDNSIRILPLIPYEDSSCYQIRFDETICFRSGKKLPRFYYMDFTIKDGKMVLLQHVRRDVVSQASDKPAFTKYSKYHHINQHVVRPPEKAKDTNKNIDNMSEDFDEDDGNENTSESQTKKKSKLLWLIPIALVLIAGVLILTREEPEQSIFESGVSQNVLPGSILSQADMFVISRDVIIEHNGLEDTTRFYIWDYGAEDGDSIQIFIDNKSATTEIFLLNIPIEIEVPTTGEVEVRGITDGGGGITYAVYCELNGTTYLNDAPIGGSNKYTFSMRE